MNEKFEIVVALPKELIKYKDFFSNAIQMYFDLAIGRLSCDYKSTNKEVSTRLVITQNPEYYKILLNHIEKEENKLRKREEKLTQKKLVTNILSSLLQVKIYN